MRTSAIAIILLIITNMGFGNYRLQQEKDTATHQQDEIDTSNDWAPILYEHPSALLIGTTALIACIIFSKIYFTQTLLPHAGIAGGALKKT